MVEQLKSNEIPDGTVKKAGKTEQSPVGFMDSTPAEVLDTHPESFVAEAIRRGFKKNRSTGNG